MAVSLSWPLSAPRGGLNTNSPRTGRFSVAGEDYYWKINYYDRNLEFHSPDLADPEVTMRVLTIMRVDEY